MKAKALHQSKARTIKDASKSMTVTPISKKSSDYLALPCFLAEIDVRPTLYLCLSTSGRRTKKYFISPRQLNDIVKRADQRLEGVKKDLGHATERIAELEGLLDIEKRTNERHRRDENVGRLQSNLGGFDLGVAPGSHVKKLRG